MGERGEREGREGKSKERGVGTIIGYEELSRLPENSERAGLRTQSSKEVV